jgi:hypothetical protein
MLTFKNFLLEKQNVKYEYSCVMLRIPKDFASKIKDWAKENLPSEIIYDTPDKDKGIENDHHVTALYGLYKVKVEEVINKLKDKFPGEVSLELGKMSLFKINKEGEPYEVLKIDVISDDLVRINGYLRETFPYSSDYPDYKPHLTIAYLKRGKGKKFEKNKEFEGKKIKSNKLIFSPPNNGKDTRFSL